MIVAVLIVKNESHVIERCLRSVLPFVDKVHISDTGSTDKEIRDMIRITDVLEKETDKTILFMPRPWEGFAASRNQALEDATRLLRCTRTDWLFMIDADDYVTAWEAPEDAQVQHKVAGYQVTMQGGSITYPRTQLFRPGLWRYRGVVHEFPECTAPAHTVGMLSTTVVSTREGDRNRDPEKYRKDAEALTAAILRGDEPDLLTRYTFYAAQSYRDAGEDAIASKFYMTRANITGGYQEERYVSLLENMRLKYTYDAWDDSEELIKQMELAQSICPHRRECVRSMMIWATEHKDFATAVHLYEHYFPVTEPKGLFIESNADGYQLHDKAGVAYYWRGDYRRSLDASFTALTMLGGLSVDMQRLADNIGFALKHLP